MSSRPYTSLPCSSSPLRSHPHQNPSETPISSLPFPFQMSRTLETDYCIGLVKIVSERVLGIPKQLAKNARRLATHPLGVSEPRKDKSKSSKSSSGLKFLLWLRARWSTRELEAFALNSSTCGISLVAALTELQPQYSLCPSTDLTVSSALRIQRTLSFGSWALNHIWILLISGFWRLRGIHSCVGWLRQQLLVWIQCSVFHGHEKKKKRWKPLNCVRCCLSHEDEAIEEFFVGDNRVVEDMRDLQEYGGFKHLLVMVFSQLPNLFGPSIALLMLLTRIWKQLPSKWVRRLPLFRVR